MKTLNERLRKISDTLTHDPEWAHELLTNWIAENEAVEQPKEQPKEQGAEPIAWIPEDELPESLPADAYNELFSHSKVDFIRLFPIYGPPTHSPREKALEEAGDAMKLNAVALAYWLSSGTMEAFDARKLSVYKHLKTHSDLLAESFKAWDAAKQTK